MLLQPGLPRSRVAKILVVDDTSYNIFVMQELLAFIRPRNLEVLTALNGEQALELINLHNKPTEVGHRGGTDQISIIFMDL